MVVSRPPDVPQRNGETPKGAEQVRIAQLEQNIKFLQEQHHLMLTGLHNEIEVLKNRNRGIKIIHYIIFFIVKNVVPELQFQLIFSKEATPSSPSSSSEDEAKHKVSFVGLIRTWNGKRKIYPQIKFIQS